MGEETKDKQEQISEDLLPLYDGVQRVTKFAVDTEKRLVQKLEDQDSRQAQAVSALEEKVEKGFGNVVDRIEILSKRSSFVSGMNFEQDNMSAIKGALPERTQKSLNQFDGIAASYKKGEFYADPVGVAAGTEWFRLATKLQLRQFAASHEQDRKELTKLQEALEIISKTDLGGATDAAGGYAVPNIVASEVLKLIRDAADIYPICRQVPMSSDTLIFPDEANQVIVRWLPEAGVMTEGNITFGAKTLTAFKIAGRSTFSLELLNDANVSLLPFLQSVFAEKIGGELDRSAMEGTDSLNGGSPFNGVNNASSVNSIVLTTLATGTALTYAQLVNCFTKGAERYTRMNGYWIMNANSYAAVIALTDANGMPVVQFGRVPEAPSGTILGRPVVVSARLQMWDTNSTSNIYFGPPSALVFGTNTSLRWDVTDQVSWAKYQADARLVGRFGFVVGVPAAWTKMTRIKLQGT